MGLTGFLAAASEELADFFLKNVIREVFCNTPDEKGVLYCVSTLASLTSLSRQMTAFPVPGSAAERTLVASAHPFHLIQRLCSSTQT